MRKATGIGTIVRTRIALGVDLQVLDILVAVAVVQPWDLGKRYPAVKLACPTSLLGELKASNRIAVQLKIKVEIEFLLRVREEGPSCIANVLFLGGGDLRSDVGVMSDVDRARALRVAHLIFWVSDNEGVTKLVDKLIRVGKGFVC